MKGSCTTHNVQVSVTAQLDHFSPSGLSPRYHWSYQINVRNFRPSTITITSHRLFVHDSIGVVIEEHDYGLGLISAPPVHAGKSYTCTRNAITSGDGSVLYGYLRIEDCGRMLSIDLPQVELESRFYSTTQLLN
jgi:uncharacterized protein affecting Mg2+/Co2+ transport